MPVVHTHDPLGLGLGLRQRGQKQSRQNRNDGDDDQKLNQGESPSFSTQETAPAKKEVSHKRFAVLHFAVRVTGLQSYPLTGLPSILGFAAFRRRQKTTSAPTPSRCVRISIQLVSIPGCTCFISQSPPVENCASDCTPRISSLNGPSATSNRRLCPLATRGCRRS